MKAGPDAHPIKPAVVSIDSRRRAASFTCRARGSLPAARLQWFWSAHGDQHWQPMESSERVRISSNETDGSESELVYVDGLAAAQHLGMLACRATNHQFAAQISDRALEVQVRLDVKFKPIVRLLGENLPTKPQTQFAGTHLRLHCNVQVSGLRLGFRPLAARRQTLPFD